MNIIKKNLQIAIDGPVAAGKSNVAQRLAKRLGILYIYTGAMYRAVGYLGTIYNLDLKKDEDKLVQLVKDNSIQLYPSQDDEYACIIKINGKDITPKLFTHAASKASSDVATLPKIRKLMVQAQQTIANNQSVVMEGRDITNVVLPNADLKIYMQADVEVRANRRLKDLQKQGYSMTLEQVIKDTKERDFQDLNRKADPLQIVKDAWVLDTTDLTMDQVIQEIVNKLEEKKLLTQ